MSINITLWLLFFGLMPNLRWLKWEPKITEVVHNVNIYNQPNKYQMKKTIQF